MYDDIYTEELLKEAAVRSRMRKFIDWLLGRKAPWHVRAQEWLAAQPERLRGLIRGRPLQAALLAALLGGGLGAGTTYALSRRSSLDDLIDDLADEDIALEDYDDLEELEKEAALEELLEEIALQELLE